MTRPLPQATTSRLGLKLSDNPQLMVNEVCDLAPRFVAWGVMRPEGLVLTIGLPKYAHSVQPCHV